MPSPYDTLQGKLYPDGVPTVNEYTIDPGVCILPLAEDPPTDPTELAAWSPVVVLRLHAPYRIRKFTQRTTKENNAPVVAAPQDAGAFVFVGGSLGITNGLNTTLNNFDWTVVCDYTFVEDCVSRNQDGFVLGMPPMATIMDRSNRVNYPPAPVSQLTGAVAQAGTNARSAYTMGAVMGQKILASIDPQTGAVTNAQGWGYNAACYFPGTFLNGELVNGGPGGS